MAIEDAGASDLSSDRRRSVDPRGADSLGGHSAAASAVNRLLDQHPDPGYIDEWTKLIASYRDRALNEEKAFVIFRLANEWFALSSSVVVEVMPEKKVHWIPHRSNDVLRGLINYQGMLTACVDLRVFLGVGSQSSEPLPARKKPREMIVLQKDRDLWIFSVDEVKGMHRFCVETVSSLPATLSKSTDNYLSGVIPLQGKDIGCIDEELLFYGLKRKVL